MPTKKEILKAKLDPPHSAALAPPWSRSVPQCGSLKAWKPCSLCSKS
jgi:hypothetical protein